MQINYGQPNFTPSYPNEPAPAGLERGQSDGTNRINGVIVVNSATTNCTAITQTLAHELGHTFGLDECGGCAAGSSVMNSIPCTQQDRRGRCIGANYNDTTQGQTGPTNCDNNIAQQAGAYTAPTPTPTPTLTPTPTPTPEECDGIDNDGDGLIDEGFDIDNDGWTSCNGDCRDWDQEYFPDAPRHCGVGGGADRDCDGLDDELQCIGSPIVIDIVGNGFNLTNAANGVTFDLNGNGLAESLSWTAADSDDSWLALDRNGNGRIDSGRELFGNFTPQPEPPPGEERQGFLALAEYDKPVNGGNNDDQIDARDNIFSSLRLWQDSNHNGISEQNELKSLASLGLAALDLKYKESRRTDEHGNQFKYRAKVTDVHGAQVNRWAWDVFLVSPSSLNSANSSADAKFNLRLPPLGFIESLVNKHSSRCGG